MSCGGRKGEDFVSFEPLLVASWMTCGRCILGGDPIESKLDIIRQCSKLVSDARRNLQ